MESTTVGFRPKEKKSAKVFLRVNDAHAEAWVEGEITEGAIGIEAQCEISGERWEGLTKKLIVSDGVNGWPMMIRDGKAIIPHEALREGVVLMLGVDGWDAEGNLRIPTILAGACYVSKSVAGLHPMVPLPPSPDIVSQILAAAERALEIAADIERRADEHEFDGKDGYSPTVEIADTEDGYLLTVTDKDGEHSAEIKNGTDYQLTEEDKEEIAGMVPGYDDTEIWDEVEKKMVKHILDYDGTHILEDGEELTFAQLYAILMEKPDFCVLVYNNYAYHPNGASTSQIVFSSEYPVNGYDRAHRITMLANGTVTATETESEHTSSRVNAITEANEGSTVQYPSVKGVADYVKPIKEGLTDLDSRLSESIVEIEDALDGFVKDIVSDNKYDALREVQGYVSSTDGAIVFNTNTRTYDEFIDLSKFSSGYVCGCSYTASGVAQGGIFSIAFYDSSKTFMIGYQPSQVAFSFDIPRNARYCKVSFYYSTARPKKLVGDYHVTSLSDAPIYIDYYVVPKEDIASTEYVDAKMKEAVTVDYLVEKQPAYFEAIVSPNRYDIASETMGYRKDNNDNMVVAAGFRVSDYIDISDNDTGYVFAYVDSNMVKTGAWSVSFYDENRRFLSAERNTSSDLGAVAVPGDAVYARVCLQFNVNWLNHPMLVYGAEKIPWIEYYNKRIQLPVDLVDDAFPWHGKTWLSYGDSITAIGNGNPPTAWQQYVTDRLHFGTQIVRGIGGQTYKWGTNGGSVTFVNSVTGEYVDRNDSYNKDNYTGSVPSGSVAIRGAFCSWDRITHMIPDSIKNSIDLIFLFGVNDGYHNDSDALPSFSTSNITDVEWATAAENVFGGDFDVTTLNGAVASTLMKLQARCPNALIVIGTSWSGRGAAGNTSQANMDSAGESIYKEGLVVEKVSGYYGVPCIDLHHTLFVNCWNRGKYVTDTIHPYNDAGKKALARAVISGLKTIYPRFDN